MNFETLIFFLVNISGCGTTIQHDNAYEFDLDMDLDVNIDPLTPVNMPFTARNMPDIRYDAPVAAELYMLVIMDVGLGFSHGIIANIPGNDVSAGLVSF